MKTTALLLASAATLATAAGHKGETIHVQYDKSECFGGNSDPHPGPDDKHHNSVCLQHWCPNRKSSQFQYGTDQTGVIGILPSEGGFNSRLLIDGISSSYWSDVVGLIQGSNTNEVNIVIEVPKGRCAKLEVSTKVAGNPIRQDVKNGMARFYAKGPEPYNYGMIPQTWESEYENDPLTGRKGDRDPIDVVDLSSSTLPFGLPVRAKVLGIIGMVDDGETDWKVITVAASDINSERWDDIGDVDPTTLADILLWLQTYKSTDCLKVNRDNIDEFIEEGKLDCGSNMYHPTSECAVSESEVEFETFGGKPNALAGNPYFMDKTGAMKVIRQTHDFWSKLQFTLGYAHQPGVGEYHAAMHPSSLNQT